MNITPLFNAKDMSLLVSHLKDKLLESSIKRELIDVTGFRGIGKTYALIEFAKKFNLAVVVPMKFQQDGFRKEHGYSEIYAVPNARGIRNKYVVIEEGVDLKDLQMSGLVVVTGYCNTKFH